MLESVYDELDDTDEFNDDHEYTPFAVWLGNDLYNDSSSSQSAIQIAKILKRQDPNQILVMLSSGQKHHLYIFQKVYMIN